MIPRVVRAALDGTPLVINGQEGLLNSRDYIHVEDVADAFVKAYQKIETKQFLNTFNICREMSYTPEHIIQVVEALTDKKIDVRYGPSRKDESGDIVGWGTQARINLDWSPRYSIHEIIQHQISWELKK